MNSKIKTLLGIVLFILMLGGAYYAYNLLRDANPPLSGIGSADEDKEAERSTSSQGSDKNGEFKIFTADDGKEGTVTEGSGAESSDGRANSSGDGTEPSNNDAQSSGSGTEYSNNDTKPSNEETTPSNGSAEPSSEEKLADGGNCMTVTDIVIVDGEETTVPKRMCRAKGASGYARA
jgi:hypothetical protein